MNNCKYCDCELETQEEKEIGICNYCQNKINAISDIRERCTISTGLKAFDVFATENDFVELTEWTNGEGVDMYMISNGKEFQKEFTWGELEAIALLACKLGGITIYK